jgi:hypothetical protein
VLAELVPTSYRREGRGRVLAQRDTEFRAIFSCGMLRYKYTT